MVESATAVGPRIPAQDSAWARLVGSRPGDVPCAPPGGAAAAALAVEGAHVVEEVGLAAAGTTPWPFPRLPGGKCDGPHIPRSPA